jgi:hypothetical protein
MGVPPIETLVARIVELLSDPRVCRMGENALRSKLKSELRKASSGQEGVDEAIDHMSRELASHAGDVCRQIPAEARAVATAAALGGVIYGVTQMPEEEIRNMIARTRVKLRTDLGFLDAPDVTLTVAPTLAPLVGGDPSAEFEIRRQWQQRGTDHSARLRFDTGGSVGVGYTGSRGSAQWGAEVSRNDRGRGEGRVYFSLRF